MAKWQPGQSGNPSGRCKTANAWAAATGGKKSAEVAAEALKIVYERMLEGPDGDAGKGDPDWRFATQKVLDYTLGPPKQEIELSGSVGAPAVDPAEMTDEQIVEARAALAVLKRIGAVPDDPPTEH